MENVLVHNREMKPKDWAFDAVVALLAFAFGYVQMVLAVSSVFMPNPELRAMLGIEAIVPDAPAVVALAFTTLPLVLRRRFPWPVFVFAFVVFLGLQESFAGYSLSIVGPMVALFTLAVERSRTETVVAAVVAAVGVLLTSASTAAQTVSLLALTWLQNIALLEASVFAGYSLSVHRSFLRATEQRAEAAERAREEAERAREEEAARRVEAERVRIAREVHDITAHSLSAVSIQAAAAERLVDRDPAAAKEAIATARQTAKDALEEIRSMIGVLRAGEAAETEPTAGTERLADLAGFLENAGVRATIDVSRYDVSRVPAFVDIALYGIAREAATNIVRHAQATQATLTLSLENEAHFSDSPSAAPRVQAVGFSAEGSGPSAPSPVAAVRSAITHAAAGLPSNAPAQPRFVCLVIEDNGSGSSFAASCGAATLSAASQGGHGIDGMTERARLLGGTLVAENRPEGGFRIRAVLPVQQA